MTLLLDEVVDLELPPTVRFRLRIYTPEVGSPVVVVEERLDNSGPPAAHVVSQIAEHVRSSYLPALSDEPVWVEAWLGRALSALVQDTLPFCTYMQVLPSAEPPQRTALSAADLTRLTGGSFDGPAAPA
ncbi:MAG: hypothetical protein QOE05_155 [Actinomycetota bacterium]|jgi:hypothetical protein|nr:hypothetical protein [Actinomycetota bacterium]